MQGGEGLHADEVVHHARRIGVVGAVVELVDGARGVLEAFIPRVTVGGESAEALPGPPQPRAQPHSRTHFSFTSWACLGFTTPMGLDRSRKTAGLLRSKVGDT